MDKFDQTCRYKLIYIYSIPYATHEGLLKIGETNLDSTTMPDELLPNCRELNQAAKARIKQCTGTASIPYTLLHTELAVKNIGGFLSLFGDKAVHKVLNQYPALH